MTQLTFVNRDAVFTNSWIIAESIGRKHQSVTRQIQRYKADIEELGMLFTSTDSQSKTRGQERIIYHLNEQQSIFLMTLMDNSPIVIRFKKALSASFVQMKDLLREKKTIDWQQTRELSKQIRLQETDAIKELVEYATLQGSKNAGKLYLVYSKLVKQTAGYDGRDRVSTDVLTQVIAFESILRGVISEEMTLNTHYKQIYQKAKEQLTEMKRLWTAPRLTA